MCNGTCMLPLGTYGIINAGSNTNKFARLRLWAVPAAGPPTHRRSLALSLSLLTSSVCLSCCHAAEVWSSESTSSLTCADAGLLAGSDGAHRREVELPALARAKSSFRRVPR